MEYTTVLNNTLKKFKNKSIFSWKNQIKSGYIGVTIKNKKNMQKKQDQVIIDINAAYKAMSKARTSCTKYITEKVKENGGEIVFDTDYDDENITVMYDGGNHPEYASNCFSPLTCAYIYDNTLTFEIAECKAYDVDRVNTYDLMTIATAIYNSVMPRINKRKGGE